MKDLEVNRKVRKTECVMRYAQTHNDRSASSCNGKRHAKTGVGLVTKELEDASVPDGEVNSAEVENLSLRIRELEESELKLKNVLEDYVESDSTLRNRVKELELSNKTLLATTDQLNAKVHQAENANVRVKGRLQDIQEELVNLVEIQEKAEKKQKQKLHWLQERLKTKEDEVKSQSEYFEHYKQRQKQQTAMLREKECCLRGKVSRLEKQVLDLSAHIALLTSKSEEGMVQDLQQKLESAFPGTYSDREVMKLKTLIEIVEHDVKSHLETLQHNVKLLREKEEDCRREQADLLTQLQCSQDSEDFLRRKLEESCQHVCNLKLSEIKLQEQVEELLDENRALKDQGDMKLKKEDEEESCLTRLENGDNIAVSVDLNGELVQADLQNLRWGPVLDPLRSKATPSPTVLLHAKESETSGCGCDWLEHMEKLSKELRPVLECNFSASADITEELSLTETEQISLRDKRAGALEDTFILFRHIPSYPTDRLPPPCSEKLTNDETSKDTRDEEHSSLFKEKAISLPAAALPVSVVEALMRNNHIPTVTTMKKVMSLNFSEANTTFCPDGLFHVSERGFSDKASAVLCGKTPCTAFTFLLEKDDVERHQQNKQIPPKSRSENKNLGKDVNDGKYQQKICRGRAKEEEMKNEKARPQKMACALEEISKVLNKTELIRPGKQGMNSKANLGGPQGVQNTGAGFKDLKKHSEGSSELMENQGNLSEICIPDEVSRVYSGGDIIRTEEKGEQPQKPSEQINPSRNGLEEKKEQALRLCGPKEENSSCQKMAAERMQRAYPQKASRLEEEKYPLNISSPMQEKVFLKKVLLLESNFYEYFCHVSSLEADDECNVKIRELEKVVAVCSQRIFLLMQENEKYSEKVCMLQEENERYAQKICALAEEMDAYFQYVLAVDEANISFQNLLNEKEIAGECFHTSSEENTMNPETICAETFSKNLSWVEEKNRNSGVELLLMESNKLPKSVLSLDGRKRRYFQLLSDLKEERNRCFKDIAKLLQDKENCVAKTNELAQERERNLQRISLLEGEKEALLGSLAEIKGEQDKCRTLVSELQECKTNCYQRISGLQEEKCVLRRDIDRIKRETSEQLLELQKANVNFILENNKLKELMSSLGFTCEDLRKDKNTEAKEKIVELKEENTSQQHDVKPRKVETACSVTQTEEKGILLVDPSNYFTRKEGSTFKSYSVMKEQLERAKEELKMQQKELEKSKKEAQKWYRELGFAETRYEEIKTHLTQVLSELEHVKQETGDQILGKQHCKLMPVYAVKEAQEMEENKIACKRLEQQVLTLKAQLRDQAALQNQFQDLQNEVELLQAQLCEKVKELQKRKSEVKLTLAPLKAKLACLVRKCQQRNNLITRMHGEFRRQGIVNSTFDEEVKKLVNDVALAEYTTTFTPECNQEMLPPSADISQANGDSKDHETHVKVNEMTGPMPTDPLQNRDGLHSSCLTPNMYASSAIKLNSPERIIALHRELRQNHYSSCQIPSLVSSNSNLKADCNLPGIREEASWPIPSKMNDALKLPESSAFYAVKGRDQLSKCDDVFLGQIGNQHAGAIPQGMKQKNVIMNNTWISREKPDGSTSATTAKSYLSDVLSASNKGRNPVGRNQLHWKD
ncbi:uncharacterized protein C4orf50 homolog [Dromaius novaehollandiae]|uniref:uncharacterized protein C4orf50 homolog n=1 Tax=Dromaius novaehollandiae TaxID=8790 RepID=UPI00311E489A